MMKASILIRIVLFLTGAVFCFGNLAYLLSLNQQCYNVLFIAVLMPLCIGGSIETLFKLR